MILSQGVPMSAIALMGGLKKHTNIWVFGPNSFYPPAPLILGLLKRKKREKNYMLDMLGPLNPLRPTPLVWAKSPNICFEFCLEASPKKFKFLFRRIC